jgi:hypothetical protein
MRTSFLFVATILVLGASSSARADDGATCGDAFDESQVKRDAGSLLEARRFLRICAGPNCSPTQQKLCSEWLGDVDARLPSVVLSAKDGAGADLVEVKVLMDGVQIATRLDGRSIDVDPGLHSFVFERADGTRAETNALAAERSKGKVVLVTYRPPPPALVLPVTTAGGERSPLKTAGLVVGAAGVVGLALGAVFGVEALSTKASHCSSNDQCDPGSSSTAYRQATLSTLGFAAGGALLVGGVTLYLLAPKGAGERREASLAVAPAVGYSPGGLQVAGRW